VTAIKTDGENKVQSVILSDGTELSADLVIMGLGVHPNTEFLKGSGVQLATDGGVICDPFL